MNVVPSEIVPPGTVERLTCFVTEMSAATGRMLVNDWGAPTPMLELIILSIFKGVASEPGFVPRFSIYIKDLKNEASVPPKVTSTISSSPSSSKSNLSIPLWAPVSKIRPAGFVKLAAPLFR